MFGLVFTVILGVIVIRILSSVFKVVSEWSDNSSQPLLTAEALVVAKRSEVEGSRNSTDTTYYVTFETNGGLRNEFKVSGRQFGMLAEGDRGTLIRQGSRFQSFQRNLETEPPPAPVEPPSRKSLSCAYCGSAIPLGQIKCASCGWTWKPGAIEPNSAS